MATVKEITHDSSTTLSDFYTTITDVDGAMSVTPAAALDGSINGVNIDLDAGLNVPVLEEPFAAISGNEIRFRARINIDNLAFAASQAIMNLFLRDSSGTSSFRVTVNSNAGATGALLTLQAITDIGITVIGLETVVPGGDTCFEIGAIRETADGNADGIATLYVGNSLAGSATNLENFNTWADNGGIQELRITFGVLQSGDLYYDEFILDDSASVDLGCTPVKTLAAMTKPAAVDAAGEFIYVALLEGTPILTKISTALDADGTTVFNPGGGDNIGVECGRFSSDTVWVAGNFDGTNVVEKSEDGGSTFTVKDDATIGDVRTFVMGPDSDERILVFDETNGDLLETNDDGASWTAINAAVTPEVNAIGRLGENVQESVFGNDGGANNSINYSVNSGGNLEDFQTGVYPNSNATRVIVN